MSDDLTPETASKIGRGRQLPESTDLECLECGGKMEKTVFAPENEGSAMITILGAVLGLVIVVVSLVVSILYASPIALIAGVFLFIIAKTILLIGDNSKEGWKCSTCGHVLIID